jgi:hypothetical protein
MFDGTCERVSTGKSYRTQGERTQTVSHPATRHFMMFCPVLISESVIVTPQVHMFKLRTFAFLNLRPRELTGGSGDTSRVDVDGVTWGKTWGVTKGSCKSSGETPVSDSLGGGVRESKGRENET